MSLLSHPGEVERTAWKKREVVAECVEDMLDAVRR